jgi:S1-C subfamily serine protease
VPAIVKKNGGHFAIALLLTSLITIDPARARARPNGEKTQHVAPSSFGRVFEENRAALVQVQGTPQKWSTGFVIGARGEVVFGAQTSPPENLTVRTDDGQDHPGTLLGYDKTLGLAVLRIEGMRCKRSAQRAEPAELGARTCSERNPEYSPLRVAKKPGLVEKRWVVTMKHDAKGRAAPFAGVVEADATIELDQNKAVKGFAIAPVLAPAAPGSPVLSATGELVGVALEEGARATKVVAIDSLVPFLKAVVLGRDD